MVYFFVLTASVSLLVNWVGPTFYKNRYLLNVTVSSVLSIIILFLIHYFLLADFFRWLDIFLFIIFFGIISVTVSLVTCIPFIFFDSRFNDWRDSKLTTCLYIVIFIISGSALYSISCQNIKRNGLANDFSISPDDKKIIFSFYKKGKASIYTANIDGSNVKRLTFARKESHLCPRYSSDGSKILFLSSWFESNPQSRINIMNSDGTQLKQVTSKQENITEAIFSSDDKTIFYLKSEYYGHYSPIANNNPHDFDIYSILPDGSCEKKITDLNAYSMSCLSLIDKGERLLFSTSPAGVDEKEKTFHALSLFTGDIYSFDPEIKSFEEKDFREYYRNPCISQDGRYLSYSGLSQEENIGNKGEYEVFVKDLKTKEIMQITKLGKNIESIRFLNKQNKIMFIYDENWTERFAPPNLRLMKVDVNGDNLIEISLNIFFEFRDEFSFF